MNDTPALRRPQASPPAPGFPRGPPPPDAPYGSNNQQGLGPDYYKRPTDKMHGDKSVHFPVFPHCDGFGCDLPRIDCNHGTPPLSMSWSTLSILLFFGKVISQNVCYIFFLMYMLIEYPPQMSLMNLLLFSIGRGAQMLFLNLMYAEYTGAYMNPYTTLVVYFSYLLTYQNNKSKDGSNDNMDGSMAGMEFLKGVLVILISFGALFLGVLFVWLLFIFNGPAAGFAFGSPIMSASTDVSVFNYASGIVLSTWQGVAREAIATFMVINVILYAHSDPHIKRSSLYAALLIAGSYMLASMLFGQTTNAIINPFYYIVSRLMNILGGDQNGFSTQGALVYILGPLVGAVFSLIAFVLRYSIFKALCDDPYCLVVNNGNKQA